MRCLNLVIILIMLGCVVSCGSMTKLGVKTVAPSLKKASVAIEYEHDWDHFKDTILAQLKLLELLNEIEPSNDHLLESLIKGYSGLGFGVYETLLMADDFQDKNSPYKLKASEAYSRAISFSKLYFKEQGAEWSEIVKLMNNTNKFNEYLDKYFNNDDLVALFYTTQAVASLINLNRDKVALMGQINLAVNMLNWVCAKDPKVENGMCVLFQAGLMANRPRMLGGNPKLAESDLRKFFKNNPDNALGRIFYLQYIVIPQDRKKDFNITTNFLNTFFINFEKNFSYPNVAPKKSTNLFNAIAKKRFLIMKQYKKEIF